MSAKAGDRIEIESETVGTPTREGEILEVMQGELSVRYRIRWHDGHETVFTPSGGTARIIEAGEEEEVVSPDVSAARSPDRAPREGVVSSPVRRGARSTAPARTSRGTGSGR